MYVVHIQTMHMSIGLCMCMECAYDDIMNNDIIMLIERLSLLVCFHRIACVVKGQTCHNRKMGTF